MKKVLVFALVLFFVVAPLSGEIALASEQRDVLMTAAQKGYTNEDKVILNVTTHRADIGDRCVMYTTSRTDAGWHGKVTWTVNDPDVLALQDVKDTSCVVLARKEGTASVRATAPNGNYAECAFTVITPIKLSSTMVPLKLGETTRMEATIHPSIKETTIDWDSSDEDVATVDANGVVTAHGFGWTVIKASVSGHEVKCAVYITPTEGEAYSRIHALKSKYKHGKKWTSANVYGSNASIPILEPGVTGNMGGHIGWGCIGFALLASDAAFNNLPISYEKMVKENIKVGDILRLRGGWHYVLVLKKDSKGITVVEGNWQKKISWGRRLTWSYLKKNADLILTRYEMVTD